MLEAILNSEIPNKSIKIKKSMAIKIQAHLGDMTGSVLDYMFSVVYFGAQGSLEPGVTCTC